MPTFPNANYLFHKIEYDYWEEEHKTQEWAPDAFIDSVLPVVEAGNATMVAEDHQIDNGLSLEHTPGHTPGSQCFLVENRLVAGDTLFLEGCGRTDLPGGDPAALYDSLHNRLSKVPDEATLFPGHLYSPEPMALMGQTRQQNYVFLPRSEEQWLTMFAG